MKTLVDQRVALTSTLTVFEAGMPGRPVPPGVIPGFSNQRQLELLVEAGFTPLEAIAIGTRNGARFLGRDGRIGTIAPGKQADLMVVTGDPSRAIGDVRKVETVFRQGVGFDSQRLIQSVSGRVGLW